MSTYRTERIERQVVDQMFCDLCGNEIKNLGCGFDFAALKADWGYDSKQDTEQIRLQICESCIYEKIMPLACKQPANEASQ